MCTLIILRQPDAAWPLLLAANRDELETRPSLPPARHWPDRRHVVAGLDELGGGSWLGVNDDGLVCAVLNRHGTLGPEPGKRSRGELVLDALDHADAADAASALTSLNPAAWRPFNLVIADSQTAWWLRHAGDGAVGRTPIPSGVSILASDDLNEGRRARHYLSRFGTAAAPDPAAGDWSAWTSLLADRDSPTGDPRDALCIVTDTAYGTRSSSLVALPRWPSEPVRFLHAEGRPGEAAFEAVTIGGAGPTAPPLL
jgi:hypothetical protein